MFIAILGDNAQLYLVRVVRAIVCAMLLRPSGKFPFCSKYYRVPLAFILWIFEGTQITSLSVLVLYIQLSILLLTLTYQRCGKMNLSG